MNKILHYLPNISDDMFAKLSHIIEQSKTMHNFNEEKQPTNDFELHYANYLKTNDKNFEKKYIELVKGACQAEFHEWYEYITKHLFDKRIQEAFNLHINYDDNWQEKFKENELLGWSYNNTSIEVFMQNIEKVQHIGEIMRTFFNERTSLSTLDKDYFESDHADLVLNTIKALSTNNYTYIIDQLKSDKVKCMIDVYGWDNTYNYQLLDYIRKNYEYIINR